MDSNSRGLLSSSTLMVAIDDTDTVDSEYGTGRVSRFLGEHLAGEFAWLTYQGSVRQQLLVDPRVPYTTHNSAACLLCKTGPDGEAEAVIDSASTFLSDIAADGSDPGLCVTRKAAVTEEVSEFGRRAGEIVVREATAYDLADEAGIFLDEYGGTGEGVIGALAAVGRTATGDLGRFVGYGQIRSFEGDVAVEAIEADGIRVLTEDGETLHDGTVQTGGWIRPNFRDGIPTLEVESTSNGKYRPTNLDR